MSIQLAGCAIINERNELLLLWKKKQQHFEFPGGKVEEGESNEEAAIRESKEELGVTVSVKKYLGFEEFVVDGSLFHSHIFLGIIEGDQTPIINEPDKFEKLFWLPINDYEAYSCAPNVITFCEKIQNGIITISTKKHP